MEFMNPYVFPDIQTLTPEEIDSAAIKKARKRVLAELELSENADMQIGDITYAKTDLLRALDDLEDPAKRRYYHLIWQDTALQEYLTGRGNRFFDAFTQPPHYADEGFRGFVGPFFAQVFNKQLWDAFDNGNATEMQRLTERPLPLDEVSEEAAFKRTRTGIQELMQLSTQLQDQIKGGLSADASATQAREILAKIKPATLNALPPSMALMRDDIAQSMRNLSIALHNEHDLTGISCELLDASLKMNLSDRTRAKLEEDAKELEPMRKRAQAQEANPEVWKRLQNIVDKLRAHSEEVDLGHRTATTARKEAIALANLADLNAPEGMDELRDLVARGLRNLAVSVWNKHSDSEAAIAIMMHAFQLRITEDTRNDLTGDLKKLEELQGDNVCYYCKARPAVKASENKVSMFKITARNIMSKSYQKAAVPVGRCKECEAEHSKNIWFYLGSFVVSFILLAIIFGLPKRSGGAALLMYGVAALVICLIVGWVAGYYYYNNKGIKRKGATEGHPLVQKMLAEGWKFGEEPGRYD